ncbi:MAG: class D beta-lactamase [Gammaproteobacteria bacterium]
MRSLFLTLLLLPIISFAAAHCFIVSDGKGKTIHEEGDCRTPETPASTFKIPLALMGFDSGILKGAEEPVWAYKPEYSDYLPSWKHDQTPRSWMRNSVVWYSQLLTKQLGMEKFQSYVDLFNYGNKNLSGDSGKNNGLTNAWLESSLKISPQEQIVFLKHLVNHDWKLSSAAYNDTKDILQRGTIADDWKLFGKTGSATPIGWFVGWVEKDGKIYLFAYLKRDEHPNKDPIGRAENRVNDAKAKLEAFLRSVKS